MPLLMIYLLPKSAINKCAVCKKRHLKIILLNRKQHAATNSVRGYVHGLAILELVTYRFQSTGVKQYPGHNIGEPLIALADAATCPAK